MSRFVSIAAAPILALGIAGGVALAAAPPVKDTRSPDPALVKSGTYVIDPHHGRIVWTVVHNGYSHLSALLPLMDATLTLDAQHPENSKLSATIHIDKITTGVQVEDFDGMLKGDRYFDIAKYPTATFTATRIERTAPNKANITGDLTLHGVTKPVTVQATFIQAGEGPGPGYRIGFDGHATLKRSEFGITGFLPSVSDDVDLTIEAEFVVPRN